MFVTPGYTNVKRGMGSPSLLKAVRLCAARSPAAMPSRLGPFEVGQVFALHREGYSHREIAARVMHGRGCEAVSLASVGAVVRRLKADACWLGGRAPGSGRKRKTTDREDKMIVRATKRHRGSRKINSTSLQAFAPTAEKVSKRTIRRRLRESGLRYLRRRSKTVVPPASVAARLRWATWVKAQKASYLRRWVYTDGVSFYLGRTDAEHANATRAALGLHVWREAATKDALFKDCLGPSSYAKAQGAAVRVWGLLWRGKLYVRILARGEVMNRSVYMRIIKNDFKRWLRGSRRPILVQDLVTQTQLGGSLRYIPESKAPKGNWKEALRN